MADVQGMVNAVKDVLGPTIMLCRSGNYVFGAHISNPWRTDAVRFGNPKCFLFSVTLDVKFPYHGRQKDSRSQMYTSDGPQHDCVLVAPNFLQFGLKDLIMESNFDL